MCCINAIIIFRLLLPNFDGFQRHAPLLVGPILRTIDMIVEEIQTDSKMSNEEKEYSTRLAQEGLLLIEILMGDAERRQEVLKVLKDTPKLETGIMQ